MLEFQPFMPHQRKVTGKRLRRKQPQRVQEEPNVPEQGLEQAIAEAPEQDQEGVAQPHNEEFAYADDRGRTQEQRRQETQRRKERQAAKAQELQDDAYDKGFKGASDRLAEVEAEQKNEIDRINAAHKRVVDELEFDLGKSKNRKERAFEKGQREERKRALKAREAFLKKHPQFDELPDDW